MFLKLRLQNLVCERRITIKGDGTNMKSLKFQNCLCYDHKDNEHPSVRRKADFVLQHCILLSDFPLHNKSYKYVTLKHVCHVRTGVCLRNYIFNLCMINTSLREFHFLQ
jgi:hypothetical protein